MTLKKVIIIGGDHHNTLAAIRCFGNSGIHVITLIHSNEKNLGKIKCSKSKFARGNCNLVDEQEDSIMNWLLAHETGEKEFVFPCSDLAAYTLDKNRDTLKKRYNIPGFQDTNVSVRSLMNKWNQFTLANELGVRTPMTWKYIFGEYLPNGIVFPCILKPVVSAVGLKSDIVKVNTDAELDTAISELKKKGYTEILIQEYVNYTMQYLACGCVLPKSDLQCGTIFEKQRESKNGSTGLGVVTSDLEVASQNEKIIRFLQEHKYWGCYDIEFFRSGEEVVLNEINLRHSGAGCLLIDNGVPIPFYWYQDGQKVINPEKTHLTPGTKFISEIDDLYNVRIRNISFFKWGYDCIHTTSHTIYNRSDLLGTLSFYNSFISIVTRRALKRG